MDCFQLQGAIKQNNEDWTSGDQNSKKKNGCYAVFVWKYTAFGNRQDDLTRDKKLAMLERRKAAKTSREDHKLSAAELLKIDIDRYKALGKTDNEESCTSVEWLVWC